MGSRQQHAAEPMPSRWDEYSDQVGRTLEGRYEVWRSLAQGGMGRLFVGYDSRLAKPVAIKILATELAGCKEALARFEREAIAASRVRHPNAITVLDMGRTLEGAPFLVLELLDGHDLKVELERRGPLSLAATLDILRPIADALDCCHRARVVHRDVKPSNIFLHCEPSGRQSPRLLDYGVAVFQESGVLTMDGSIVGTPWYLPPEALETSRIGPRGDAYSLSMVAFKMLTGEMAFARGSKGGPLGCKVLSRPRTLTEASGRAFQRSLEAAMVRGLSFKPGDRFPTCTAFVDALAAAGQEREPGAPDRRPEIDDAHVRRKKNTPDAQAKNEEGNVTQLPKRRRRRRHHAHAHATALPIPLVRVTKRGCVNVDELPTEPHQPARDRTGRD